MRQLAFLCPIMLIGGIAWVSVLAPLTVAAQQASPPWVRARALAVNLIVFQAGMAGGSALWGVVAAHAGLNAAYFGIAAGLLLSAGLAIRLRPAADKVMDFTPAHHWPDPAVAGEPSLEAGPVMMQVEYRVENNPARMFLLETCCEAPEGQAPCGRLYELYRDWCESNGYSPLASTSFGKEVRRAFPKVERREIGPRGSRIYAYCGLSIR